MPRNLAESCLPQCSRIIIGESKRILNLDHIQSETENTLHFMMESYSGAPSPVATCMHDLGTSGNHACAT